MKPDRIISIDYREIFGSSEPANAPSYISCVISTRYGDEAVLFHKVFQGSTIEAIKQDLSCGRELPWQTWMRSPGQDGLIVVGAYASELRFLQRWLYDIAKKRGHFDNTKTSREFIADIHSEVSEVYKAVRDGNQPSERIAFTEVEEELADILSRTITFAEHYGHDVVGALYAKAHFNDTTAPILGRAF